MKKNLFFLAAIGAIALTSCTNDEFIGENGPNEPQIKEGAINFGFNVPNTTRANVTGAAAADLLGNKFVVLGVKGDGTGIDQTTVFSNYVVEWAEGTAKTTESNTADWEYVGVSPIADLTGVASQTIKFWDYNTTAYDFAAFSAGKGNSIITSGDPGSNQILATPIVYAKTSPATIASYTLKGARADLAECYITDMKTVAQAAYGNEVQLQFRSLASKARMAIYETVPGYSVQNVRFYTTDAASDADIDTDLSDAAFANATLFGADAFYTGGLYTISFPTIGSTNSSNSDYNKAHVVISGESATGTQSFGTLNYTASKLGTSSNAATFAGAEAPYYQTILPNENGVVLEMRVNYDLVSDDGSNETITVHGAKAFVPATYTKWLPNYAYTYIFKISDNTNGWTTSTYVSDSETPAGLFPITFDAVVAEATDASGEQTTVSTVATPSIITYQQGHTYKTNEFSKSTKGKDNVVRKLYVQVMHNEGSPEAHPVGSTYANCPHPILSSSTALLYEVSNTKATEADVMDALENRTTDIGANNVTGRNKITLTKNSYISAVSKIVNGPDDNPITIASDHGNAAEIDIANAGVPIGTYAFVYDYTSGSKTTKTLYQPMTVSTTAIPNGTRYITKAILDGITTTTSANETVNSNGFLYFSKTTDGTGTTTYSYYSVDGKTTLPAGLLKVAINDSNLPTSNGSVLTSTAAFIFDVYTRNNGSYAVKIIKIVA